MAGGVLLAGAPETVALSAQQRDPWTSCTHFWTCDGLTWDLTGRDGYASTSGISLMAGVRGLNMPPIQHYRSKSASVPGSRWRGSTTDERTVFWPLEVYNRQGSQAWIDYNRQFWSTLRPDKTGVWSVTQPGDGLTEGETRRLTLRFQDDGDYAEEVAAELFGWADYGLNFIAEQPYWVGNETTQYWDQAGGLVNYYGGGPIGQPGYGPPFVTTSGRTMSSAKVNNPGDIAGLPKWTAFGPSTSTKLGVGSNLIDIPFSLTAGQWVQINTARTDRRAMFGSGAVLIDGVWNLSVEALATGVNRTRDLGATTRFGEIPPGQSLPLSITMTGTGAVRMDLVPLYYTAR